METSPVISIQHLTKLYGSVTGVNDISLEIYEREIFGFLGPNGAGKTTTIRLILDLLRPTSGTIRIFGKELLQNSLAIRQLCGYLPGNFTAYGNLTGKEFIKLCMDLRKIHRKADQQLLDRFELSEQGLNRKIKYLSHGTMQKLGIIQAFLHRPSLLILDEPTTGLDPLMQEEFYKLLQESREQGATVFLSSHNLSEVERICHRLAIIRKGEIKKVDSIENLRMNLAKRLRFTLETPVGEFILPGAELLNRQGLTYEFLIVGDIRVLLKRLSELPLVELIIPEPDLDDIFINFYKD